MSSALWSFSNLPEIKNEIKTIPSSGHSNYLLKWTLLGEWTCSHKLSGPRQLINKCGDRSLREGGGLGQVLTVLTSCHFDLLRMLVWTSSFSLTCFWSGWKYHEAARGARKSLRHRDSHLGMGGVGSVLRSRRPSWMVWMPMEESSGARNSRG